MEILNAAIKQPMKNPFMNKKIIHLLSGGLDSVTMMYDLLNQGHSVHALMFDYRQRHRQELLCAKYHAKKAGVMFTVLDLPPLGGLTEQSWVVPNRNAIFLSVAVNFACESESDAVTIGCNKDDEEQFPDCRHGFIDAMQKTVNESGYRVEICAPYLHKRKWEIAGIAREMGIDGSSIWTCYNGGLKPCGTCPACVKLHESKLI